MKHAFLFLLAGTILFAAPVASAQDVEEEAHAFVAAEVPDVVMKAVVQRMVAHYFKPSNTPKKVYFSNNLIRPEWLPKIKNIEFVVLTTEEAGKRGLDVNVFSSVEVNEGKFLVKYGVRKPDCSAGGHIWYFWVWGSRLRLWKSENEGWGSGCGGGTGH